MRWIPRGVALQTNFRKYRVQLFGIARRTIVAKGGFAQRSDDLLEFLLRAEREIGSPDRRRQPRYRMPDLVAVDQEGTMPTTRLANFHVIAGRYHEVRRP